MAAELHLRAAAPHLRPGAMLLSQAGQPPKHTIGLSIDNSRRGPASAQPALFFLSLGQCLDHLAHELGQVVGLPAGDYVAITNGWHVVQLATGI